MCMTTETARKLLNLEKVLKHWRGSINRDQYTSLIYNFAGIRQDLPSWDSAKRYLKAAGLMQTANGCTISHVYVTVDFDEGTESWSSYKSHFYKLNRRRRWPGSVEEWRAIA